MGDSQITQQELLMHNLHYVGTVSTACQPQLVHNLRYIGTVRTACVPPIRLGATHLFRCRKTLSEKIQASFGRLHAK